MLITSQTRATHPAKIYCASWKQFSITYKRSGSWRWWSPAAGPTSPCWTC
uniref:Uncharacterized protein n=1 Tax=Anguilla anguilla TaxID=7936 RepID=A0A0E9STQ5_ANGAN